MEAERIEAIRELAFLNFYKTEWMYENYRCNNNFIILQLLTQRLAEAMKNISSFKILNYLFEYFKLNRILYWFNK